MPVVGYIPGPEFNRELRRLVRTNRVGRTPFEGQYSRSKNERPSRLQGALKAALAGATDFRVAWDQLPKATFVIYKMQSDGSMKISDPEETVTVYNRTDMAFAADTFLTIEKMWGIWHPFIGNCNATSGL